MPCRLRRLISCKVCAELASRRANADALPSATPNTVFPPPIPTKRSTPAASGMAPNRVLKFVTGKVSGKAMPALAVRPLDTAIMCSSMTTAALGRDKSPASDRARLILATVSRKSTTPVVVPVWRRRTSNACWIACTISAAPSGPTAPSSGIVASATVSYAARLGAVPGTTRNSSSLIGTAIDLPRAPKMRIAQRNPHSDRSARIKVSPSKSSVNTAWTPNSRATSSYARRIESRKRNAASCWE